MEEETPPGVYIEVQPGALIVPDSITVGNIGIVGTANPDDDHKFEFTTVYTLSSYAQAKDTFGLYNAFDDANPLTLVRALQLAYRHGASKVLAVPIENIADFADGLEQLVNENVHIIVVAGGDVDTVKESLEQHIKSAMSMNRERIAVIGTRPKGIDESVGDFLKAVSKHNVTNDRIVVVTPGIKTVDQVKAAAREKDTSIVLPGAYAAAAVAGMLSARSPHVSITNKTLSISGLEVKFNPAQLATLVIARVCALEQRQGYRVVKGITTNDGAFQQITTRRIVDYAKFGVRSAAKPYSGLLNNDRVRKALKGSINGLLASMVDDEMLIGYVLDVTATREEERRGIAVVTMTLRPTFTVDYIKVVIYLE